MARQIVEILPGEVFDLWTVIRKSDIRKKRKICYEVRCVCYAKSIIPGTILRQGKSLGCSMCRNKEGGIARAILHQWAKPQTEAFKVELDQLLMASDPQKSELYQAFIHKWAPGYAKKPMRAKKAQ